jgi:hypothetical protein
MLLTKQLGKTKNFVSRPKSLILKLWQKVRRKKSAMKILDAKLQIGYC